MAVLFVDDPFAPRRRHTRVVRVGEVEIGGTNPIRVQSMTTTDTQDVAATVAQAERLVGAGCEIVRVTAPSTRDAHALREIREALWRRGIRAPLVADIHFTPNAAQIAVEHVEKVRINPGNFADKKRFEVREYDEAHWREEIERVAARFRPLVRRCRELGRALRIGTNHGSLSDRILNRFGDTPLGMVQSALEFLDVCEDESFHDVIFSMKASNAQVAIEAYRLLAEHLRERARNGRAGDAPFHLGVTEAGDAEDGRIKSAIGIGSLLEDGLGDTIRVSLTEDPVKEIPVARALAARYDARRTPAPSLPVESARDLDPTWPFREFVSAHAGRRKTGAVASGGIVLGGTEPVRVELELGPPAASVDAQADELARALARQPSIECEGFVVDVATEHERARARDLAAALASRGQSAPLVHRLPAGDAVSAEGAARLLITADATTPSTAVDAAVRAARGAGIAIEVTLAAPMPALPRLVDDLLAVADASGVALLCALEARPANPDDRFVHRARLLAAQLCARGRGQIPIVLRGARGRLPEGDTRLLSVASDLGAPLCDGIGDAISLPVDAFGDAGRTLDTAYRILQGARLRSTRTEFISCPSCGRTLFDLERTTARIKARTAHLPGLKIAIMGCIVNGPGEMADADFGYVGSGPGTVSLYVGKELVERHVPEAEADDRLVALIRARGAWRDPQA